MNRMLLGGFGIAVLSMICAGVANAQSENSPPAAHHNWGYVTHGKHSTLEMIPPNPPVTWSPPPTQTVETGSNVPQPGDFYVRKVVGKHTQRVLVHDVPVEPQSTTNPDGSPKISYAYIPEGKSTYRREFYLADKERVFRGEGAGRVGSGRR